MATNKEILREAKGANPILTIRLLSELHKVSNKTIESWLYESKNQPPSQAVLDLYEFLRLVPDSHIPDSLNNLKADQIGHIKKMARRFSGKNSGLEAKKYLFFGEPKTVSQMASQMNVTPPAIYRKLARNDVNPGDEVGNILESTRRRALYHYRGKRLTLKNICDVCDSSIDVHRLLLRMGIRRGDTISAEQMDYIKSAKGGRGKKAREYIFDGERVTVKQFSDKIGLNINRIYLIFRENNIKPGDDITELATRLGKA